jgi:hypothetical protein
MDLSAADTPTSIPTFEIEQYFVVPVTGSSDPSIQKCRYFNAKWHEIRPPEPLMANDKAAYVAIKHSDALPQAVKQALAQAQQDVDRSVSFFAAVAKTKFDSRAQPNMFLAAGTHPHSMSAVLPVAKDTTRGVILIFKKIDDSARPLLISTSDPEIKNGSTTGP